MASGSGTPAGAHWEAVYHRRAPEVFSWYRPHLETSLALIERAAGGRSESIRSASIIDVGGGESTLVDDLLARGYRNITVLDISPTALAVTKKRLGPAAEQVQWRVADVAVADAAVADAAVADAAVADAAQACLAAHS